MANISNLFEALVTNWRSDIFHRARLKLTVLYMIIMCIVTAIFSVTLYFNLTSDLQESVGSSLREDINQERFFEERDQNVFNLLLLIDAVILLISSGTCYVLAGYTLKPIKSAMIAQEKFTADASHELRTPLAVMQTQIEVLLRSNETLSGKTRRVLSSILDETKGLVTITADLLTLARENRTAVQKTTETVSLSEVMAEVIEHVRVVAEEKNLEVTFQGESLMSIHGNKGEIKRIFLNLVDNAVRYTRFGGHIKIILEDKSPDMFTVSIKDDGIGISNEDLKCVFDRFYKADNARQSVGSGLGLSIVKQLVESLGGRIVLESELGKGTTITLHLKKIDLV